MFNNNFCGCCNQLPPAPATCETVSNVVNSCNVQEYPHIINYHTHHNNALIKKHVNIPQYTQSDSFQVYEEFAGYGQPQPFIQPYPAPIAPYGMPYEQSYGYNPMPQPVMPAGNIGYPKYTQSNSAFECDCCKNKR